MKSARLSKSIKRKLRYTTTKTTVTLIIKGVRTGDEHARKAWVSRLTKGLDRRKVNPLRRTGLESPLTRSPGPNGSEGRSHSLSPG